MAAGAAFSYIAHPRAPRSLVMPPLVRTRPLAAPHYCQMRAQPPHKPPKPEGLRVLWAVLRRPRNRSPPPLAEGCRGGSSPPSRRAAAAGGGGQRWQQSAEPPSRRRTSRRRHAPPDPPKGGGRKPPTAAEEGGSWARAAPPPLRRPSAPAPLGAEKAGGGSGWAGWLPAPAPAISYIGYLAVSLSLPS